MTPLYLRVCLAVVALSSVALSAHDRITTKVTWDREISRIVQARCIGCHRPEGPAPMALGTYEQARPWARAIREEVLTRRMPKWQAARGYGDFTNDPSLSPFEIALMTAWADGGAPKSLPTASRAASAAPTGLAPRADGPAGREINIPCGDVALEGRLAAVRPELAKGGSVGISATLPDGRREVVAWIRGYDPRFPTTYWLRAPLELPRGSRVDATGDRPCSVVVTVR